ncbi:hypothetical protein [Rhodocyclus purpureus]|uniref:hypothetical protein n=1 Tax=Rhodocyclus purpureus TaxID=1067 RepID=UPI001912998F|nr:hypothetical protein [Rhodocyclus purpureus]MBK5913561.1 hypothetical protein [Rhodocyclus purpureus]
MSDDNTAPADDKPREAQQGAEEKPREDWNKLLNSQNEVIKSAFSLLAAEARKGELSVSDSERDKFHVTARTAEACTAIAARLAELTENARTSVAGVRRPLVVLADADTAAVHAFVREDILLAALESRVRALLPEQESRERVLTLATGVAAAGSLLTLAGEAARIFRSDRNLAYTIADLSDDVLLDLVAAQCASDNLRYPAGELDRLLDAHYESAYARRLEALLQQKTELAALGDKASTVLDEFGSLLNRLAEVPAGSKTTLLFTLLRGELVRDALQTEDAISLSVGVISKGGTSMKVSHSLKSDTLFAAGGLIVSYRICAQGKDARLLTAGILVEESGFKEVPFR